jgi:hypothetical protein
MVYPWFVPPRSGGVLPARRRAALLVAPLFFSVMAMPVSRVEAAKDVASLSCKEMPPSGAFSARQKKKISDWQRQNPRSAKSLDEWLAARQSFNNNLNTERTAYLQRVVECSRKKAGSSSAIIRSSQKKNSVKSGRRGTARPGTARAGRVRR